VFLGRYEHTLDDKGRVVVPKKFRDDLADGCVITKGQENCLYVFSMDQWDAEVAKVGRLPRTDRRARRYSRSFFADATDQKPDRQGRIQIPEGLRGYARLDRDVMVIGVQDRIEIWAESSWGDASADADEYYSGIEEALSAPEGI
jgi:MraZ protein